MKRKPKPKPEPMTPGSPLAVLNGCTCSPLANNYGRGFTGVTRFSVAPGCPIHARPDVPADS